MGSLKSQVRDALSIIRQFFKLPHNKTRSQILKVKATFDSVEINHQRVYMIARATSQTKTSVKAYLLELDHQKLEEVSRSVSSNTAYASGKMSIRDSLTLYSLVRSLKPSICVETGVGAGGSATYILGAIVRNSFGRLFSIDVQSRDAQFYGELIPDHLREQWELRIQQKQPLLPILLKEMEMIDFFLHDSRHTFRHMLWEFEVAWHYLKSGGCLASHDIVTTTAFEDFRCAHVKEIFDGGVVGNFGFLIKR